MQPGDVKTADTALKLGLLHWPSIKAKLCLRCQVKPAVGDLSLSVWVAGWFGHNQSSLNASVYQSEKNTV